VNNIDVYIKSECPYFVLNYHSPKAKSFLQTEIKNLRERGIAKPHEINNIWVIQRQAKVAEKNARQAGLTVAWF
jgi:hypothetical protein